ncbi:MAG TPA: hypothetical protein QF762_05320 [Acidimicrobiales bacterium]|nr:hypothetical protein [Acidimicrobiales bacterium]
MSSIPFRTPIPVEVLQSDDQMLQIRDRSVYSKILLRERRGGRISEEIGVEYGGSRLRTDGTLICGSRPGEWTLYNASPDVGRILETVKTYSERAVIVDLTHGRALISLEGSCVRNLLEKICNIDFSDEMVPDGASFSASVGTISCDLIRSDSDTTMFLLACERSSGEYLFRVLADAGKEFGLNVPSQLDLH